MKGKIDMKIQEGEDSFDERSDGFGRISPFAPKKVRERQQTVPGFQNIRAAFLTSRRKGITDPEKGYKGRTQARSRGHRLCCKTLAVREKQRVAGAGFEPAAFRL